MQRKAKISLKTKEETINYSTEIDIKNNKINYMEDETNVLFDMNNKLLVRDNKDIYMEYDFSNKKGFFYIKELRCEASVIIDIEKIVIEDNLIEIIYNIDNNNYFYKIEME